jgi:hypothetical protein
MGSRLCFCVLLGVALSGCGSGDDNSPSMGAVPPKPNPNMNAKLPQAVRDQIAQSNLGGDAKKMQNMKPHP